MTGVVHGWRSSELWAVLKNLPARPSAALDSLIRRGLKMAEQRERCRMRSRDIKVLSVAFSWFGFSRPLSKWAFKKVRGCVMSAVLHERSVELLAFFGNTHTHTHSHSHTQVWRWLQLQCGSPTDAGTSRLKQCTRLECCVTCSKNNRVCRIRL